MATSATASPASPAPSRALTGTAWTLLAAAGFSAVSILTSLATRGGASLSTVLAWRYLLASLVLGTWVMLRPSSRRMSPTDTWRWLVIGGGGQALLVWLALSSLSYISAATLGFLFYTYPSWVALIQAARGAERIDRRCAVALALSFGGIFLMVGAPDGSATAWKGYALALGAAVVYGVYIPTMALLQGDLPVAPTSTCAKIGSAACFVVLAAADRTFTWQMGAEGWAAVVALTLLSTVLPSVFFLMGLMQLGPVRTAIVSTVEPFMTALLGLLVLAQPLTAATTLGGALIIAAVVLLQSRRASTPEELVEAADHAP